MAAGPRIKPQFTTALVAWYVRGHRDLPWRRTRDPYRIWVSEIMLQQTRAQAVTPYYERFLERFPTIEALASASENDVLALWSGLGYYSRARNLRRAAQLVCEAGAFPRDYEGIRALPGIGDYTAAAIASIAFGLPYAVLDGNVMRVVSRVANDASDISAPATRTRFREVAQGWLDRRDPGRFNQALMELGAAACLPRNPMCGTCPVATWCQARAAGTVAQLPVKLRRAEPVQFAVDLLLIRKGPRVLLGQRAATERRMAGFWDLPRADEIPRAVRARRLGSFRHTITHHHYTFAVWTADAAPPKQNFRWFTAGELGGIPLATIARKGLKLAGLV